MCPIHYRKGTPEDDSAIATHFYKLWLDNNVAPKNLRPDWKDDILAFITQARASLGSWIK
jgi:hypothetical protein